MRNRKDGERVTNINAINSLIPHIKPLRADSDVYINSKIDITELSKYYNNLKKNEETKHITYFHLFNTGLAKIVYNRPLLNRFVANKRFYDRNNVTISFVAKKEFTDTSEENMSVIKVDKDDNIFTLSNKFTNVVSDVRNQKNNSTDDLINLVGKFPKFLKSLIIAVVLFADRHGLLPNIITNNLIYYSTILVSNLGSIGCGAIYHNLTELGTNSILVTIGEIKEEPVVINGKVEVRTMCEFGANIDERIADGFYFIKSLKLFEHILQNPKLLEDNCDTKIDF